MSLSLSFFRAPLIYVVISKRGPLVRSSSVNVNSHPPGAAPPPFPLSFLWQPGLSFSHTSLVFSLPLSSEVFCSLSRMYQKFRGSQADPAHFNFDLIITVLCGGMSNQLSNKQTNKAFFLKLDVSSSFTELVGKYLKPGLVSSNRGFYSYSLSPLM